MYTYLINKQCWNIWVQTGMKSISSPCSRPYFQDHLDSARTLTQISSTMVLDSSLRKTWVLQYFLFIKKTTMSVYSMLDICMLSNILHFSTTTPVKFQTAEEKFYHLMPFFEERLCQVLFYTLEKESNGSNLNVLANTLFLTPVLQKQQTPVVKKARTFNTYFTVIWRMHTSVKAVREKCLVFSSLTTTICSALWNTLSVNRNIKFIEPVFLHQYYNEQWHENINYRVLVKRFYGVGKKETGERVTMNCSSSGCDLRQINKKKQNKKHIPKYHLWAEYFLSYSQSSIFIKWKISKILA